MPLTVPIAATTAKAQLAAESCHVFYCRKITNCHLTQTRHSLVLLPSSLARLHMTPILRTDLEFFRGPNLSLHHWPDDSSRLPLARYESRKDRDSEKQT